MTRVAGSSSQYSSRSLLDTSALLPTLTKVESPMPRLPASARIARPSAPLCEESPTWPGCGNNGENEAFSRIAGLAFEQPHAVGAHHPHPVTADAIDQRLLRHAPVVAGLGVPGGDDHQ